MGIKQRVEYAKGFTVKAIVLALIIAAIMIPMRITGVRARKGSIPQFIA